jgi:hypothetical protein
VEKDASGFWVVEAAEDHKNIKVGSCIIAPL